MRIVTLCVCLISFFLIPRESFARQSREKDTSNDNYRRVVPGDDITSPCGSGYMVVMGEETKFLVEASEKSELIRSFARGERLWIQEGEGTKYFLLAYDSKSDRTGWILKDPEQVSYQRLIGVLLGEKKAAYNFVLRKYFELLRLQKKEEFE